jgi:benzoyl-CoA reductase/2-hydroxyglutaryl-CoA dehydratase subunit BcrC/BadD/HgdB
VPLALVGGPLPSPQWHLFDTLEAAGGRVVLNATEGGERSLTASSESGSAEKGDRSRPLDELAARCLARCADVFQRPNTPLYEWLGARLAARGVRGLVLWHYVGCDLWRAEAQSLREAFKLPVLLLDADEVAGDAPRTRNRLEAFVETLRA